MLSGCRLAAGAAATVLLCLVTGPASGAPLAASDRQFIDKATEAGMGEIETAKLAEHKAANDQVKQFAARMVHDHTAANDKLRGIAENKGVMPPARLDQADQKELGQLDKLSGSSFDKAYMKHQVSDHQKAVKEFGNEAKHAKDPDLRRFASETLPVLEEHLKLAKEANASVASSK
ncbi:MAG TPA: DUF4142 domain-containing protein [Burkholderiales bacterium]|nr:DUF4142 domain-containing protein [Burkholderiales bacterium]